MLLVKPPIEPRARPDFPDSDCEHLRLALFYLPASDGQVTVGNDNGLLDHLTAVLSAVPGVRAVVLGGSRARGAATEASDYDIGLYYEREAPPDIAGLGRAAVTLAGASAKVTATGEWGPWINGGAWLTVAVRRSICCTAIWRRCGR